MRFLSSLIFTLFLTVGANAQLNHYQPGSRLIDGSQLNKMVDVVNNLSGHGTPGPVTGTTGYFSSTLGVVGVISSAAVPVFPAGGVTLGSTTFTEAALALYTKGVAAGYKIARGTASLGGTNPTAVATGLATVVACNTNIVTNVALGLGTSNITYVISGTSIAVYGWKVTGITDNTLIASTGTDPISWQCTGT